MPTAESRAAYTDLADRIDQQFPFTKLLQWSTELRKANYKLPIDQEKLMQLVRHVTLHRMFVENLAHEAGLGNRDVFIVRPSTGELKKMNHGSSFWPDAFLVLEDSQLDKLVPKEKSPIPRAAFSAAIDGTLIAVGAIVVPHLLPLEDVDTIVKWGALRTSSHPLFRNDQEAVMCFYGGMKIVANRLLYGVDRAA